MGEEKDPPKFMIVEVRTVKAGLTEVLILKSCLVNTFYGYRKGSLSGFMADPVTVHPP